MIAPGHIGRAIPSLCRFAVTLLLATLTAHADESDASGGWANWRGPLQTGVAPNANPPIHWAEGTNILWKLPLEGLGHSTPVVWSNQIFLTMAVPYGPKLPHTEADGHDHADGAHDNMDATQRQKFIALSVDRFTGKPIWKETLNDEHPHEGTHNTGSWASQSPVTDGETLIVSFGSRGLFGLKLDGTVIWKKDLGKLYSRHAHGEGSSPALHDKTVIVNWDHEKESFIAAFDRDTGNPLWKIAREEPSSWSTPLIIQHKDTTQVIVSATGRIRSYDLKTGVLIWECGGLTRNVVASPVYSDGIVVLSNSYDARVMIAIKLDHAKGDITDNPDAIAWKVDRHTSYVPTPLIYGNRVYFIRHLQAWISCLDLHTGKPVFGPGRLPNQGLIFASPVGAGNRVYITDRSGLTSVLEHKDQPELLAINRLNDAFSASPVIIGDTIYLRGQKSLYAIKQDPQDKSLP